MRKASEEWDRLSGEIQHSQQSIKELNGELVSIKKKKSQLKARLTKTQTDQEALQGRLEQYREDLRAAAQLSTWISKARTLVSNLYGQAAVMYEMNRRQVFVASVLDSVRDLMQILDGNESILTSLATSSVVDELKNEWQELKNSIQYKKASSRHCHLYKFIESCQENAVRSGYKTPLLFRPILRNTLQFN